MSDAENASYPAHLLRALRRLDVLIARAIHAARTTGNDRNRDPWRGLHIGEREVEQILARYPGSPLISESFQLESWQPAEHESDRFTWLQNEFGLSAFDLDIVLLLLAPELDLRYERLYAWLQDDVTRKRASIDLILNVLCTSSVERIDRRGHFLSDAPLVRNHIIHINEPDRVQLRSELNTTVGLDPQIVHLLLGFTTLDVRLADFCQLIEPEHSASGDRHLTAQAESLVHLVHHAISKSQSLRIHLYGLQHQDRIEAMQEISASVDTTLFIANVSRIDTSPNEQDKVRLMFRDAWIHGAILCLYGIETEVAKPRSLLTDDLRQHIVDRPGITILSSDEPLAIQDLGIQKIISVMLSVPDYFDRWHLWQAGLREASISASNETAISLAHRFRLSSSQIQNAIAIASTHAETAESRSEETDYSELLFASARSQTGGRLATLTTRVDPVATWDDIVLPSDTIAQLQELCGWVTHRDDVLQEWGFAHKLSRGKGITALFSGASGTGKTMASEVIANELGIDLFRIDLSTVISKYIGETEKNLHQIFTAAVDANAILLFDEADALFGKRSEVRDSHDRYANIEISYLLQKMEEHDGVTILTTNLRQNLDDAFIRRLAFSIQFPFPDEAHRRQIWERVWPVETPRSDDINAATLAQRFQLSGGNIRNVALSAAYLAATEGQAIGMRHVIHALRREFQKLGKDMSVEQLASQFTTIGE